VLVLVCTGAVIAQSSERRWVQVRTGHFTVVTDLGEKRGIEVARRCEQMRATFALVMNRATTHDPAPLTIFALDGQKEVEELHGDSKQHSKHSGLFLPSSDERFILADASGDPWRVLFHEYAHELLSANTTATVQTWFEEGFAEYFSTLNASAKATRVGMVPIGELQFLRQNGKLMHFADLAAVRQDSTVYNYNGPAQAMFYAESWLLVHYLFDHQLISRAEPFFAMTSSGRSIEEASVAAFSMSLSHLEKELLDYAKGERFRYFSLPAIDDAIIGTITATPLSMVTARALQADVRWHVQLTHSKADAEAYAAQSRLLLAIEPGNPIATRSLGRALLESGQYEEGKLVLMDALHKEENDVLNHYAVALALSSDLPDTPSNSSAEASFDKELTTCINIDPAFADVYRLQALALSHRGQLQQAANVIREAILLSPRSENYKLMLADIDLKKGDHEPAVALLQELKNSHNPDISKQAEYFLSSEIAAGHSGQD
jgi:hypothetical protein